MRGTRLGTSVVGGGAGGRCLRRARALSRLVGLAHTRRARQGHRGPGPAEPGTWPDLTVVVPAYREAGVIAAKVEDLRANGYPGRLEILVVADGDPETAVAAERAGARALTGPERLGKSQALNRGFEEADTPIVVISDANNRLVAGALAAAVEHFADPDVGAVAGEKLEDDGGGGESLYWKFESWLKQREDRLGTTIGLVGELAAVRSAAWRPIPADVASDDLWTALDINEQGYRVAYEPRARGARSRRGVAVGPVGAPDPHGVRSPLRGGAPAPAAAAFRWTRGGRAVGAPPGPLHREPPVPSRPGGARHDEGALERSGPCLSPGPSVCRRGTGGRGARRRRRPREASEGEAPAGRHPLAAASAGAGHALFLQGVALGGLARFLRGDRQTKWSTVER